jgi:hypothetical protein
MQFEFNSVKLIKQKKTFSIVNCIGLVRSIDRLEFFSIAKKRRILLVEASLIKRFTLISEMLFVGNYFCFFETQIGFVGPLSMEKYKKFKDKEQEKFNLFFGKVMEILPFSNALFKTFGGLQKLDLDQVNIDRIDGYDNEVRRGNILINPSAFVFLEVGRIFSVETLTCISGVFSFVSFWVVFFFRMQSRSILFKFRILRI